MTEPQRFIHVTKGGIQFYITMSACYDLEIFDTAYETVQALLNGNDFVFDTPRVRKMTDALRAFTTERINSLDADYMIGGESRLQNYLRNYDLRVRNMEGISRRDSETAYDLAVCFSLSLSVFKHDDFLNPALIESYEWELLISTFG